MSRRMANLGKGFEEEVNLTNNQYKRKGIALIQKIPTPWNVIRKGKKIINAFPEGKSTLDFRGTVRPGISISFDCKETSNEKGLPLANILDHQIRYMQDAIEVGEVTFLLCYMSKYDKRYYIPGELVLYKWDQWMANKGKVGYNTILVEDMIEVESKNGYILDYLSEVRV